MTGTKCSVPAHSQVRLSLIVCRSFVDSGVFGEGGHSQRLGSNVKRLRLEKGWSQEEYADLAGIHRTYVGDIERAARNPTITIVEKLSKPLGVSVSALLE